MQIRKACRRALGFGAALLFSAVIPAFSQTVNTTRQDAGSGDEVSLLKQQIAQQQKQIEALQTAMNEMKARLDGGTAAVRSSAPQAPSVGEVASTTPVIPRGLTKPENASAPLPAVSLAQPATASPKPPADEVSPLQIHLGSAYITPVGFMDFTSVWRSKNNGSGIGTNFAGIPYSPTTFQDNLSEFRLSMQNSRIGFRVDALVKGSHVIGYMESDYLGNNPGNVAVSSNSNTLRSRLYWVDVRKSKLEVLGGQTWSLVTPGRTGISPLPGDLFYTQNIDVNYQLGLAWGRIPELRVVFHPTKTVAIAGALDSPEQYIGGSSGGSLIVLPAALNTTYSSELNNGGNTLAVPNVAPDVIAKVAFDPNKRVHFEVGGVERNFKVWNPPTNVLPGQAPSLTGKIFTATGGAGFVNANVEVYKGLRLVTNNFGGDGGGRYIFGQAPDLIAHADGSISQVHSYSSVSGFEYTRKNWLFYGYYGGLYVQRNTAIDITGKPIGYGCACIPNNVNQNKSVQEGTLGFADTIWKDAKWGALTFMGQYSYLERNPWFVSNIPAVPPALPTPAPKGTSLNMVFLNLRYTLPGSAPTLGNPAK